MRFPAFLHRPADLRRGGLDHHHAGGRHRLRAPADRASIPEIAPPTVEVTAIYPGASAEVVAETVAAPIEQEVNGVDDMLYMTSQSTGDGAAHDQRRVQARRRPRSRPRCWCRTASPSPSRACPRRSAASASPCARASPDLLMVIHLISPDGIARPAIHLQLRHPEHQGRAGAARRRRRRAGLRRARLRHARLARPGKVAARGLTAGEVVAALRAANVQVAAGAIGQPPAPRPGAFSSRPDARPPDRRPSSSTTSWSRTDADGARDALRDIARVELGGAGLHRQRLPRQPGRRPPSSSSSGRARTRSRPPPRVQATMEELKELPAGLDYASSTTRPSSSPQSIEAVVHTLFEAVLLVVLVVHPLPADLARGDHPAARHPGLAGRHLRRHGGARLHAQQPVAVRPRAGDRHRGRRRHRGGRERRAHLARACRPRRRRTRPWTRSAAR